MNDSRSIRLHYLFRAVILLAFALYIGHLVQQDALHYYVAPKLARWIRLCPVPLSLMALSLGLQAVLGKSSVLCDCEHRLPQSRWGSSALYSLFLLPLLLGFFLPDRALGSAAAARKGLSLSYTAIESGSGGKFTSANPYEAEFAELAGKLYAQPVIPVYPEIFSETLGAISLYKSQFAGKEILLSGFLYREPQGQGQTGYAVSRFLVQCCTADATPFGILLQPGTQISLPADTWIEVRGKLAVVLYQGVETLQVVPEAITAVPEPSTPYIYTNADAAAAWEALQPLSVR
ncbi:TIGR03943 family putative permease subunit [Paenibacillus sp. MMS20-IR301]|uniref:TIGR03943 family putative permease subunit n=1 Tax=Paenibacillus sp. MMS20-IR301 TaxID=2895946 RepID=UPI0028E19286|nr:TIGR03943 family protein [Paenibacillus sp. MMS20-IR301]WNS46215.1 TIGR03943 family protein [Paenibacillus sp. MMS20-IR301]